MASPTKASWSTRSGLTEYEVEPFAKRQARFGPALDAIKALHAWKPKDFVLDQDRLRRLYSKDKSSHIPSVPAAAVAPLSPALVGAIVKICAKEKVPITPRGAGTGLEGACIPYAGGIVIDTGNLQRLDIDCENACVWVGAGVSKLHLSKAVAKHGFVFGPDPSSNPSVGGMVATSGSGMSTLKYGTTRENVISLLVVTPQGNLVQTRQVVRKSSAGLELTQLYIGSEGTLGIVCEACFRLFPATKHNAGGYATFDSTEDAVRAVVAVKRAAAPDTLLRCELLNKGAVICANNYSHTSLPESATVLLEFVSNDSWLRDVRKDYKALERIFKKEGRARSTRFLKDGKQMDSVWDARRGCLFATMNCSKEKGVQQVITTDVCVPLSKLAQCVSETEADFAVNDRPCLICAHISDGNFHILIPYCDPEDFKRARELEQRMVVRAVEAGGTVSGEHGIGVGKVCHVVREHGKGHIAVQESIKRALDPDNIMNPGCFYPSQQVLFPTAHL
ncbi:D-lactate dehydrogenase-like protein [Novymonas esmeraldas]|uniref:D-lactate dehydrogenase (cytochrome) n=1 Tax=Novymonas esmeraldas TaxID=1808958 RepID=A0AAW0F3H4_9TRYP